MPDLESVCPSLPITAESGFSVAFLIQRAAEHLPLKATYYVGASGIGEGGARFGFPDAITTVVMTDLDISRAALVLSLCLSETPKSLTWLVFETRLGSPLVSRALRRLLDARAARYLPGSGFVAWSAEQEEELLSALAEDACRTLIDWQ